VNTSSTNNAIAELQKRYRECGLPDKPDLIVILTDQERYPCHMGDFPATLTSWSRLEQHGLTFERAYTSSCMCTPSRGVLLTSNYANVTGLAVTPSVMSYADPRIPQLAALVKAQGYDVIWKGKWHLAQPIDGMQWAPFDIKNMQDAYGFSDWNPPDAGTVTGLKSFGSWATAGSGTPGRVNPANDKRYLRKDGAGVEAEGFGDGAVEFLAARGRLRKLGDPAARRPFLLFMSFVNPHDINFFPWGWRALGYGPENLRGLDQIGLPDNAYDSLLTKPTIQRHVRNVINKGQPILGQDKLTEGTDLYPNTQTDPADNIDNYVRFYAYMIQYADTLVNEFLDALSFYGFSANALIIRTSDHGEMGLSHGMREKVYNVYEETIHVPFVISNPKLFATQQRTQALYAHVDFLPTLLNLAGGDANQLMKGKSVLPAILDPRTEVQDTVLFCYDDESAMISDTEYLSHIRAIRHGHYTYAVYYSPKKPDQYQYELYDLEADRKQMNNLLYATPPSEPIKSLWRQLQALLDAKMVEAGQTPFPPVP
jgi:choline-sulfatase